VETDFDDTGNHVYYGLLTFTGGTMLRMEEILGSSDTVTQIKELFDQVKGYISDLNGIGL